MSEQALPREIRCLVMPVGQWHLLLPNAVVAEVIAMPRPQAIAGAPSWVLGRVAWRGWQVPLISYVKLARLADIDDAGSSRVAILKALGGHSSLPFVAVLMQGFPRLTTLNAERVIPSHDGNPLPPGTSAHVLVRDDVAMIPDLEAIERELLQVSAIVTAPATAAR